MYKKVVTKEEDIIFRQIWGDFCEEKCIQYVDNNPDSSRYLLKNQSSKTIGTIEFQTYQGNDYSNVESYYPFSQSAIIESLKDKRVYEVTKMCLSKEFRGKGYFKNIMSTIYDYSVRNEVDWYVAVMTYRMYLYIRTMGFRSKVVEQPFWLSKQIRVIPVFLDIKHAVEHMKTFKEFQPYYSSTK